MLTLERCRQVDCRARAQPLKATGFPDAWAMIPDEDRYELEERGRSLDTGERNTEEMDMSEKPSKAKYEANRRNSRRSTGPNDTTSTRYNAVKHALLAEGVTELDNAETFPAFCAKVEAELKPAGEIETFLARQIALDMVRLKRAVLLEAEFTTAQLNLPITETQRGTQQILEELDGETVVVLDPGLPARLSADAVDALASKFGRYETQIENRLFRHLHELERRQRWRQGEHVPAPASVDVAIHAGGQPLASFGNSPQPPKEIEP
jgi:hypothetical protein